MLVRATCMLSCLQEMFKGTVQNYFTIVYLSTLSNNECVCLMAPQHTPPSVLPPA